MDRCFLPFSPHFTKHSKLLLVPARYVKAMLQYLKDEMKDKKQKDMPPEEVAKWRLIPRPNQVTIREHVSV